MLYQDRTRHPAARFFRRAFAAMRGLIASAARRRSDARWLDGVPASRLEDLGLRRSEDGGYRFFE